MHTVGKFSDVIALEKVAPELNFYEYEQILEGRSFARWYAKNRKAVNALAFAVPSLVATACGVSPAIMMHNLIPTLPAPFVALTASGGAGFMEGHGAILIHMMIIGFLTLVVSTFLKFTGRGDLVPLIAFVGGGAILYEVIGMFKDIYGAVVSFINM